MFEQLYQLANEEIKETSGKLKEYKKTDFDIIINDADTIITGNQKSIDDLESSEDELQEQRNSSQNAILSLIETKQPTTYIGPDITELETTETDLTATISTLQQDIDVAETNLDTLTTEYLTLKKNIRGYNETQLKTNVEQLESYATQIKDLRLKVEQQQGICDAKQEKIDHLSEHEYDPDCQYCSSNIFVQNAIEAQNTISADLQILNILSLELNQLNILSDELLESATAYGELQKYKLQHQLKGTEIEKQELQLQIIENELQTRESELETSLERQESFRANESAIKHNKLVDLEINTHKQSIDKINLLIKDINESIRSKHGLIEVAKINKSTSITQLEKYRKLEIEYKAYEYYLDSVKRDGVPYELISKAMPKIEIEINNVLNQVVDFNMVLQSDGKNINGYIIYDEDNFWPLELTSGMERFISSLAIRIALINVSALPRPNFIAIDEGWGSLDAEHISSVVNLFEYFRTKFDFCIIISHVDTMRDMVDNLIEVNKINKFSQICHS